MPRERNTESGPLKVGELAESTGLTVRTLHYYEEIGLLSPSERTPAGHRLYGSVDVERLYRIGVLRRLGLPLASIRAALDDPASDLRTSVIEHLSVVERQLGAAKRLQTRLSRLVQTSEDEHTTDQLLDILEDMTMLDTTLQSRISLLVYRDIDAAHTYLMRVFGLGPGEITRNDEGVAVHGELQAGDGVVWLHPESPEFQLESPASLGGASASMAVMVDDVDAHFRHATAQGAVIQYEPTDQPYGYREYSAHDLEGHLWSFMRALEPQT